VTTYLLHAKEAGKNNYNKKPKDENKMEDYSENTHRQRDYLELKRV